VVRGADTVSATVASLDGLALKVAVVPAGRPLTSSWTGDEKFVRRMRIVVAELWPCLTRAGDVAGARLKI
jgi:hypothetical protein